MTLIAVCCGLAVAAPSGLVPSFSAMEPGRDFAPWRESRLRGKAPTEYRLVADEGLIVLRADAEASASALAFAVRLDPATFPVLRWRWKIERLLTSSDISTKRGDDYPARIYVTFEQDLKKLGWFARNRLRLARLIYGDDVPAGALCYVWDREAVAGTSVPNAYTDRVQMIVVRSGAERVGEWTLESRNVLEDYRAAFGEAPPAINSIVVATDTDDTGESATSYFGDIEFAGSMDQVGGG